VLLPNDPEMVSARDASALEQRNIEHTSGMALSTSRSENLNRYELNSATESPRHGAR
jgi:hypothetical protein